MSRRDSGYSAPVFFAQTPWTVRLLGLMLCPVAGGVISVVRNLTHGPPVADFAGGYLFGVVACLLLGIWLQYAAGHDLFGRRRLGED